MVSLVTISDCIELLRFAVSNMPLSGTIYSKTYYIKHFDQCATLYLYECSSQYLFPSFLLPYLYLLPAPFLTYYSRFHTHPLIHIIMLPFIHNFVHIFFSSYLQLPMYTILLPLSINRRPIMLGSLTKLSLYLSIICVPLLSLY